jgi:hypothetical protein
MADQAEQVSTTGLVDTKQQPGLTKRRQYSEALKRQMVAETQATEEDQAAFFELETPSPYMLVATRLRPQFREALPAIVHVDGSSRVQAVSKRREPFVHALLRAFEARTGYPVLLNTSFNLGGDPIVEAPKDAIDTFLRSSIDVLVIENHVLNRQDKALDRFTLSTIATEDPSPSPRPSSASM